MEDASAIEALALPLLHGRRAAAAAPRSWTASPACRSATGLLYALGDVLIYGPLRNVLGMSRIRVAYTAGAAIGPDLFRFYRSIGINLKQLYGSTETCAYVCLQPDGGVKFDTVGSAAPGVEIKIADNGEVLVRGPMLLKEYYKRPDATAESIDADGYFHTGDAGVIDGDGHLKIIDRAKDVGKLASGAMFAPNYIENKLKFFPHIKEAVAFGDDRDMVCAFVNIDIGSVGNWAERRGIAYSGYTDLARQDRGLRAHPRVRREGQRRARDRRRPRRLADPSLPDPAQGARSRRRRADAHAQGAPRLRRRKVRGADRRAVFGQDSRSTSRPLVKFEDGRSGMVAADLVIDDAKTFPRADGRGVSGRERRHDTGPHHRRRHPQARPHLARVRRREGAHRHLLRRPRARGARDHRPQRRGQELDAQRDQRRLPAAAGNDHLPRQGAARHGHARRGGAEASRARSRTSRSSAACRCSTTS